MRRIQLFTKACKELVKTNGQAKLGEVVGLWKKYLQENNLDPFSGEFDDTLLVGKPNERDCLEFLSRPQATFDLSLAALPAALLSLAQSPLLIQAPGASAALVRVIQESREATADLKSRRVRGLACMVDLCLTLTEQGFGGLATEQQKPFHHFMPRRSFYSMWCHLTEEEKKEWANHVMRLLDRFNQSKSVYPDKASETLRVLKVQDWLRSIAKPSLKNGDLLIDIKKQLKECWECGLVVNPFRVKGELTPVQEAVKRIMRAPSFTQVSRWDIECLLPMFTGIDIQETRIRKKFEFFAGLMDGDCWRDLLCSLTGEAIGKWDYRKDAEVSFEWRSMDFGACPEVWAEICEEVFQLADGARVGAGERSVSDPVREARAELEPKRGSGAESNANNSVPSAIANNSRPSVGRQERPAAEAAVVDEVRALKSRKVTEEEKVTNDQECDALLAQIEADQGASEQNSEEDDQDSEGDPNED
jgi:hypothetical protein